MAEQAVRLLAGVGMQPYQICFLSEPATRLNQARPDWWRRNVATFLGDRPVVAVTQRGPERVRHAVAVSFELTDLWPRLVALPAALRGGNVVFVPAGYSVDALLEALLEQRNLDPLHFALRGHFETTVAAVVPAGGLVMRLWAQDDAQVDLIGQTSLIERLGAPGAP